MSDFISGTFFGEKFNFEWQDLRCQSFASRKRRISGWLSMNAEYCILCLFDVLRMDLLFVCWRSFICWVPFSSLQLQITCEHVHTCTPCSTCWWKWISWICIAHSLASHRKIPFSRSSFSSDFHHIDKSLLNRKTFFSSILNKLCFKLNNFIDSIFANVRLVRCTLWLYIFYVDVVQFHSNRMKLEPWLFLASNGKNSMATHLKRNLRRYNSTHKEWILSWKWVLRLWV